MAVVFCLHIAVLEAELPQQFHSTHLKPYDEIGVVHHAHLVGLGVAHTQAGSLPKISIFLSKWVCASPEML